MLFVILLQSYEKDVIQQNLFIENLSKHYSSIHFWYKAHYISKLYNE